MFEYMNEYINNWKRNVAKYSSDYNYRSDKNNRIKFFDFILLKYRDFFRICRYHFNQ